MTNPKRHLLLRGTRAACGLRNPRLWTHDPAEVTCGGCSKTVAMADAEVTRKTRSNFRV